MCGKEDSLEWQEGKIIAARQMHNSGHLEPRLPREPTFNQSIDC
jgi:hypothetical protein